VTLALDSQIAEHATSALSPVENDILNGTRFALAWRDSEVESFLDQTWIDGWLREAFTQYADGVENRSERDLQQAMRSFEYQAHWLNLLTMLGEQLTVPEVKFVTHTLSTPAIPVDLILDVGNTHTCGVIIEDHGDANDGLRQTAELQVRSLSEPQFLNEPLFTSRLEFSEARFGKQHFSVESGREDAFVWPSIVRVGDEARKLAMQRLGTEGNSGISSPRRYLWDETPVVQDWRFSQMNSKTQREPLATAFPLMNLMNDDGEPLFTLPQDERLPVFSPQYSRSTLMTHMLCELLAQALGQINSVATRLRLGFPASPRQLRTLILTLPSAMPKQEREIFRRRMFEAIAIVWKAMGWHPQDEDFVTRKQQEKAWCRYLKSRWSGMKPAAVSWSGCITKPSPALAARPKPSSPPLPVRTVSLSRVASRDARCASRPSTSAAAQRIWRSPIISWMTAPAITSKSPRSCCSVKALRWRATTRFWT
jgi:hypothetical protein